MLSMATKHLEIVERSNKPSSEDSPPSLFVLDALLQLISIQCQVNTNGSRRDEIKANIERMERICGENGIIDGCQLLHSAYTMKSMTLIKDERVSDALKLLEETYVNQLKKLRNDKSHPFLEQCISQMALLQKVTQKTEDAIESYTNLAKIKELYYGEATESLVITLKNLGAVQTMANKNEEATATLERAITIVRKVIDQKKVKDQKVFNQHVTEIIFLLQSTFERAGPGQAIDLAKLNEHEALLKEIYGGERSAQFSYFLFLKAKKMMMSEQSNPELTIETIKRSISILEDIERDSTVKSSQLGRCYYFQGTLHQGL